MKKTSVLFFALFVLLPVAGWTGEYVLVMSKEDNVCQHMLKIYNADLKKYGEVRYDEHEEFTAIKWEEKKYYRVREGKKEYPVYPYATNITVLMSRFDINNDGKEEVVIKDAGMVFSIITENLFYFKGEDSAYFKEKEFDIKILYNNATGRVGGGADFERSVYYLKKLPQIYIGIIGGKEAYSHYPVGPHFYVNPFNFKGAYYIDMKDMQRSSNKWLVILKYAKDNQIKDICYFLKASDCKSNKPKRRK